MCVCYRMVPRVHGILQARILEWLAFPFFRGSSQPGDRIGLRHCRQIFFQLSHKGSPRILEWVAYASPVDLLNPELNRGLLHFRWIFFLPTELSGKP